MFRVEHSSRGRIGSGFTAQIRIRKRRLTIGFIGKWQYNIMVNGDFGDDKCLFPIRTLICVACMDVAYVTDK